MGTNYASPSAVSPSAYIINNYTLGNIVQQAYRLAGGLVRPGQGISPSEQIEIMQILNDMIDGWKIEALTIQFTIRTVVQVLAGQSVYSVGPGQQWDIERPEQINSAGFILQYNQGQTESELPMFVITSYEQWQRVVAKKVTSTVPLMLYYQATTPFGSATIWPVPQLNSSADSTYIAIYTPGLLQEFQTLDDAFISPKGYREAIEYNLAVRIHQRPPYNKLPMEPTVYEMAVTTKTRIKDQQITPLFAYPDPAVREDRADYYSGIPKAWTPY